MKNSARFSACAACLLLLFLIASAAALSPGSGELRGHLLAVTTIRTGDTEIFAVDPETGDARNLTRRPDSEDRYPTWSPDGRRIAFTSNRDGAFNLYVMDADGGNVRQLTREKAPAVSYMPSWSGDGRRIVFGLHGEKALMASVAPDGTDFKILGPGHDPNISPDGKKIAYTEKVNKGYCVFVMDADGRNARQITQHEDEMGAVHPIWSPDGTKILYSDQVGEALEIFVCDADGRGQKQLTKLNKISTSAAWSPDGAWISFRVTDTAFWRNPAERDRAYADKAGDKRPIYVMRADGSNPRIVEPLRYQCGIDGSRAAWKPRPN